MTTSYGEPIVHMRHIEFDYKENYAYIKFKDLNPIATQLRLDTIVRVCDEVLLSCNRY